MSDDKKEVCPECGEVHSFDFSDEGPDNTEEMLNRLEVGFRLLVINVRLALRDKQELDREDINNLLNAMGTFSNLYALFGIRTAKELLGEDAEAKFKHVKMQMEQSLSSKKNDLKLDPLEFERLRAELNNSIKTGKADIKN